MPRINIDIVKAKLRQLLAQRQRQSIVDHSRWLSAVLLPLYVNEGQWHILFIKRAGTVKYHKGQVSFPGGTREERDGTLLDTALRECAEEIGLDAKDVEVLGELDDVATMTSNYIVSPFVAVIPWPYQFKTDKNEVEEVFEVPVPALLDRASLHRSTRLLDGETVDSYDYHYQERIIWGATAQILGQFLDIFSRAMPGR